MIQPVLVKIIGDNAGALNALRQVNAQLSATRKTTERDFGEISRIMQHGALVAAAAGATLGFGIVKAVRSAAESERVWNHLQKQLENVGENFSQLRGEIDATARHYQKLTRFGDEDVAEALTALVRGTHSYAEASKLLAVTLDLAAAKQLDTATAGSLVAKAYNGQTRALKEFGIVVKDGRAGLEQLREQLRGTALEDGKTLEAQMRRVSEAISNVFEAVGNAIAGDRTAGIGGIADAIQALADLIDRNSDRIHGFFEALAARGRDLRDAFRIGSGFAEGGVVGGARTAFQVGRERAAYERAHQRDALYEDEAREMRRPQRRDELLGLLFGSSRLGRAEGSIAPQALTPEQREKSQREREEIASNRATAERNVSLRSMQADVQRFIKEMEARQRAAFERASQPVFLSGTWRTQAEIDATARPVGRGAGLIGAGRTRPLGTPYSVDVDRESVDYLGEQLDRAQDRVRMFADNVYQAMLHATQGADDFISAIQNITRSLLQSASGTLFREGSAKLVAAATAKQAGRLAAAKAIEQFGENAAGQAAAAASSKAASATAAAGGPVGIALIGASLAASVLGSLLGRSRREREDEMYRAHVRALNDHANRQQVVVQINFPTGSFYDTGNHDFQEAVTEALEQAGINQIGRFEVVRR